MAKQARSSVAPNAANSTRPGNTVAPQEYQPASDAEALNLSSLKPQQQSGMLIAIDRVRVRGGICNFPQLEMAHEMWTKHVEPHGISFPQFLRAYEATLRDLVKESNAVLFEIGSKKREAHRGVTARSSIHSDPAALGELARYYECMSEASLDLSERARYAERALALRVSQLKYYSLIDVSSGEIFNPSNCPSGAFSIAPHLRSDIPWTPQREKALVEFIEAAAKPLNRATGPFYRVTRAEALISDCIAVIEHLRSKAVAPLLTDPVKFENARGSFILQLASNAGDWGRALFDAEHRDFHFGKVSNAELARGALLVSERACRAFDRLDRQFSLTHQREVEDARRWATRDLRFRAQTLQAYLEAPGTDLAALASQLFDLAADVPVQKRPPKLANALFTWTIGAKF